MTKTCRYFSCNGHPLLAGIQCHHVIWCFLLGLTFGSILLFSRPTSFYVTNELLIPEIEIEELVIAQAQKFQILDATLLIFSAWFDTRLPKEVRLVGILKNRVPESVKLICEYQKLQILLQNDSNLPIAFEEPATGVRNIHPAHPGSVQVFCPARPNLLQGNWLVSLAFNNGSRHQMTPILIKKIVIKRDRKLFAMCVQPFSRKFDSYHKLIEMIELNRLLGAQYFIFYDNDSGPNLQKVLDYYAKYTDFVQVVPWKFDVGEMGVTVAGQMSSLADCKHRVMTDYKYLVSTDVDEFIIPRAFKTWQPFEAMFEAKNASQLVFANYFYQQNSSNSQQDDTNSNKLKVHLPTLTSTTRWNKSSTFVTSSMDRTKSIARSECILDHYVHFVHGVLPVAECAGLGTVLIKDTMGVGHLHHYRFGLPGNFEKANNTLVVDRHLPNTYEADLLKAVEKVFVEMRKLGISLGDAT